MAKPRVSRVRLSPGERQRIETLFERFEAGAAHPKTELAYKSPFTLLVSVVLSAQATDKSVNKATEALYRTHDTPETIAALGEEGLIPFIKTIGLFRTKAKNVVALSRILLDRYGDKVTVVLNPLRSGQSGGLFNAVTLPDGKVLGNPKPTGPINVPTPK